MVWIGRDAAEALRRGAPAFGERVGDGDDPRRREGTERREIVVADDLPEAD
jgi:hypothetical protein